MLPSILHARAPEPDPPCPLPPTVLAAPPALNPPPLPFQSSPEARLYHWHESQQEAGDEQQHCEGNRHTDGVGQQ